MTSSSETVSPAIIVPRSRQIASIALFGSLSIILTVVSNLAVKIGFVPPTSYLLFDLGEIPVIICFLALGPRAGFSVAVIEWLSLNLLPTSVPLIGPLFKLGSVLSTLLGLWAGWKLSPNSKVETKFVIGSVLSAILRAAIMTTPNALYLMYFFGVSWGQYMIYLLELTALFNVLQVPFDLIPAYIVLRLPQVSLTLRKNGLVWFERRKSRSGIKP